MLGASLLLFSATASVAQEKKMDAKKHAQMMEMMKDSTMMNMMMEHMAKDDHMRMKLMHKMMEACKSDESKMMGMCKMMAEDENMHSMMMKMMGGGTKETASKTIPTIEHDQHHPKQSSAEAAASNEVLIKFKPGAQEGQIKSMASEIGMEQVKVIKGMNIRVFKITSGKSVDEVIEHCKKEASVEYAEPNMTYKTMKE
jgi:hypothetical protein